MSEIPIAKKQNRPKPAAKGTPVEVEVAGRKLKGLRVVHRPYKDAIRRHLSGVQDVQAIFLSVEDDGAVHVYSVVQEYSDGVYDKLLKQERLIEREFPDVCFEFHLRAHQGRKPSLAAPFGAQAVFVR